MSGSIEQAKSTANSIASLLGQHMAEISKVMPKHITPDRLLKVMVGSISKTPALGACNIESLVNSFKVAAELGLEPGGALGHLYLVPYGPVCTPIIGYRGLLELARRSGKLARLEAHVVYANEPFDLCYGWEPKLEHRPLITGARGEATAVYAIAWLTDGSRQVEVMRVDEVNAIRDRSRAAKSGPWVTDWAEMARKTVVRRLAKYLPLSSEMARAMEVDDEDDGNMVDGAVVAAQAMASLPADTATAKAKQAVRRKLEIQDSPAAIPAPPPSPEPPPLTDSDMPNGAA